jgi:hypothetical protein
MDSRLSRILSVGFLVYLAHIYGCETWSLTLREECKLRIFENMALRRIFQPERNKVRGEWRRLRNKEFHALNTSRSIFCVIKSRRLRWTGHVEHMEDRRGVCTGF